MDPILEQYTALENKVLAYTPNLDKARLFDAFTYADNAHASQQRKDGSPYITHPLAVADLVADLELDPDSVIAALLHDTIEDTGATHEDVAKRFGEPVAELVEGVTKLTRVQYASREEKQMENLRKMLLAMSKDIRASSSRSVTGLHNMRTMQYQSPKKQREKALRPWRSTLRCSLPRACSWHQVGTGGSVPQVSLDPVGYNDIKTQLESRFLLPIRVSDQHPGQALHAWRTRASTALVYGRIKHIYSIYRKMYTQHKTLFEIFLILRLPGHRFTSPTASLTCSVRARYVQSVPDRFKDYISTPKPNMYQSFTPPSSARSGIPFEADPHLGDAPDRRIRYCGPLEVQGRCGQQEAGQRGHL